MKVQAVLQFCALGSVAVALASSGFDGVAAEPWTGKNMVVSGDDFDQFTEDLSGLTYETGPVPVLWASRNGPSTIYRLLSNGAAWKSDAAGDWSAGRAVRYPGWHGSSRRREPNPRPTRPNHWAYEEKFDPRNGHAARRRRHL